MPSARRGLLYLDRPRRLACRRLPRLRRFLLFNQFGWRTVFLFGVVPIICVIVGRFWVKESDRF